MKYVESRVEVLAFALATLSISKIECLASVEQILYLSNSRKKGSFTNFYSRLVYLYLANVLLIK